MVVFKGERGGGSGFVMVAWGVVFGEGCLVFLASGCAFWGRGGKAAG